MPAAAATAAATVASAGISANAAGKASKAAKDAQTANLAFSKQIYSDAQGNLNPTIQGGIRSGNALQGLLGIGGDPEASRRAFDDFRHSTNYDFLFDQGAQGVKTANAPSFNSGATAKALINYGQGMAGNALAGYENLLAGQQTLGAQSAGALAGTGTQIGSQVSSANNNAAGVSGSAGIYGANSTGSALQGLAGLFQSRQTASSYNPNATGWNGGNASGDPLDPPN